MRVVVVHDGHTSDRELNSLWRNKVELLRKRDGTRGNLANRLICVSFALQQPLAGIRGSEAVISAYDFLQVLCTTIPEAYSERDGRLRDGTWKLLGIRLTSSCDPLLR